MSAADVKMKIPFLVRSLKSNIWSSTSFQMGKTFWWVVSAAVEQSRRKATMVAQGDGKFGPWGWPQGTSKPKKNSKPYLIGLVLFKCTTNYPNIFLDRLLFYPVGLVTRRIYFGLLYFFPVPITYFGFHNFGHELDIFSSTWLRNKWLNWLWFQASFG